MARDWWKSWRLCSSRRSRLLKCGTWNAWWAVLFLGATDHGGNYRYNPNHTDRHGAVCGALATDHRERRGVLSFPCNRPGGTEKVATVCIAALRRTCEERVVEGKRSSHSQRVHAVTDRRCQCRCNSRSVGFLLGCLRERDAFVASQMKARERGLPGGGWAGWRIVRGAHGLLVTPMVIRLELLHRGQCLGHTRTVTLNQRWKQTQPPPQPFSLRSHARVNCAEELWRSAMADLAGGGTGAARRRRGATTVLVGLNQRLSVAMVPRRSHTPQRWTVDEEDGGEARGRGFGVRAALCATATDNSTSGDAAGTLAGARAAGVARGGTSPSCGWHSGGASCACRGGSRVGRCLRPRLAPRPERGATEEEGDGGARDEAQRRGLGRPSVERRGICGVEAVDRVLSHRLHAFSLR